MSNPKAQLLKNEMNKALGAGTVKMGSDPDFVVTCLPTGVLPIDVLLDGGIPKGRFTEFYGAFSSLKSYIALMCIAQTQKSGGICALVDTEHAFDPVWAASLGVDVEDLILPAAPTGEAAIDAMEALIRAQVDLVVWDSLVPETMILTNRGEIAIGEFQPDEQTLVYTMLEDGSLGLRPCKAVARTGINKNVIKINLKLRKNTRAVHTSIICTPNHEIWTDRGWVKACDLVANDRLMPVYRNVTKEKKGEFRIRVNSRLCGTRKWRYEHHLVQEWVEDGPVDGVVHHKNHDSTDNRPVNLSRTMTQSDHIKEHYKIDPGWEQRAIELGKIWKGKKRLYQSEEYLIRRQPIMKKLLTELDNGSTILDASKIVGINPSTAHRLIKRYPEVFSDNHRVISIEEFGVSDTYDLCVEGSNNFVANGIIVHNSIAASLPKAEETSKSTDKTQMARQAAMMSAGLRKLNTANSKTAVFCINQTRVAVGMMFGDPTSIPGGKSLPFYACLGPKTKVLKTDFTWEDIENIGVGDELVGFDEEITDGNTMRKMRKTIVESNDSTYLPSYEIITSRGSRTIASDNHKWLVRKGSPSKLRWRWKQTAEIMVGDKILWFNEPWTQDYSYEAAYLSGIFDGEGSVNNSSSNRNERNRGCVISMTQNPGLVLNKTKKCLDKLEFKYKEQFYPKWNETLQVTSKTHRIELKGTLAERMKFLGIVRPERLVENAASWEGSAAATRGPWATAQDAEVVSIKYLGLRKVYAIGTSTRTLIADGMFSHNSLRIAMRSAGKISREIQQYDGEKWVKGKEIHGFKIKATLEKSKLSAPHRDVTFHFDLDSASIDNSQYIKTLGIESGLIVNKEKSQLWTIPELDLSVRGRKKFDTLIRENQSLQNWIWYQILPDYYPGKSVPRKPKAESLKAGFSESEDIEPIPEVEPEESNKTVPTKKKSLKSSKREVPSPLMVET